jgi:large repetitive protein
MSNRPVLWGELSHRLPVSALLLALAVLFVPPMARAQVAPQVTYDGAQITLASFTSSSFLSPVAVDAHGDAFFVASTSTANILYEAPINGELTTLNSAFPFSPSAIAVNPQGTTLVFLYTAPKAGCDGAGSVALASVPVTTGATPANMPCSFKLSGTTVTYAQPSGLAFDPAGELWIADFGGGDIFEIPEPIGASSVPSKFVALSTGQPYDIALNGDGNVYFTSLAYISSSQVQDAAYIPTSSLGYSISGTPATPSALVPSVPSIQSGLAADPFGNIYIGGGTLADSVIFRGGLNPVYSLFTNGTYGLATDPSGDLFLSGAIADGTQQVIELGLQAANFGQETLGSTSQTWTLNFTIGSGTVVSSIAVLTTGVTGLDFAAASGGTCAAGAYAGATNCTVNVTFKPQAIGQRRGAVVFYDGSNNELANVPLEGVGTGPQLAYQGGTPTAFGTGLSEPAGLKLDAAGDIFLADSGNRRVLKITPGGTVTTVGSGYGQPTDVAIDGAGNVYVSDGENNAVYEVTPAGVQTTLAATVTAPWGLAIDGAGNLYIGEVNAGTVVEFTPGEVQFNIATGLDFPYGVAVDPAGDVFIADCVSGNVYEVTPLGKKTTRASSLGCPSYIAVDPAGDLYVTNYNGETVVEVTPAGAISTLASGNGLDGPYGVALDASGNVYLTQFEGSVGDVIQRTTPPMLNFLTTAGGSKSTDSPKIVTLQDIGNTALDFYAVSYPTDFPEGASTGDCTSSTVLAAAGDCTLTIDFSPVTVNGTGTTIPLSENVQFTTDTLNVTTPQSISVTGTETKYVQTITFIPPSSATYGSSLNLDSYATSSGGLPLTFKVESGPATLSGTTVKFTGTGTVAIQATQPGSSAYAAAIPIVAQFSVAKAVLKVVATNQVRAYGQANPTLTYTFTGLVNGDTASAIGGTPSLVTSATISSPVGTYSIAIGAGTLSATNYTFTLQNGSLDIVPAVPLIKWTAPSAITYGTLLSRTQLDATASVAGKFTYTPAAGTKLAAGRQTLSVSFTPTNATDYRIVKAAVGLTVNKRTLTVTALDASVAFDKPLPAFKYTVTGFAPGETSSVLHGAPLEVTPAKKGSPVGDYRIEISQGTLTDANYAFEFKFGVLTITPAGPTATPKFKLPAGAYSLPIKLTITDATAGAVMYYTMNGSTPTTASTRYTGPISVTKPETIKVVALAAPNYTLSAVATAKYTAN